MQNKFLTKIGAFALAAGVLIPTTVAQGETLPSSISTETVNINEVNNDVPIFDVYDENRNLVKTYTKGEVEKINQDINPNTLAGSVANSNNVAPLAMNVYNFPATDFRSYTWINDGRPFYRPQSVHVIARTKTVGLAVEVYRDSIFKGEVRPRGSFTDGLNIPISHLTDGAHSYYSLLLRNNGGGTVNLSGGQVYYK
ncbi:MULTISPECIES: hypothetical protein [Bacillus cereus group]|uniref:Uncharacterized protein n=1 Tax=Bacillus cereus 03BB108 TaxID=451709 RepID=A0AAN0W4N9_BACCE|nr:hypothetical protein [Bacillus cereus]AJI08994.1 hypothetical protein AK40_5823 [Bacillus cereus 03BB108]EDX59830.1 hypothetical protein BC03BB108_B0140 [Bacillus cereus 03BB108]QKG98990.1 hypothetical protein FOC96_01695 [Bacillus cereus]HDR7255554.1 hypothetical protein [Bacillus pacificus]